MKLAPVAFSADGKWLATGDHVLVMIWSADTWQPAFDLPGHANPVSALAFGSDVRSLASAFSRGPQLSGAYSLKTWDLTTQKQIHRLPAAWVWSVAFAPDGKRIMASCHDGTIRLWETATGAEAPVLRGQAGDVFDAAFSHDGTQMVARCDELAIRVWHTAEMPSRTSRTIQVR